MRWRTLSTVEYPQTRGDFDGNDNDDFTAPVAVAAIIINDIKINRIILYRNEY